MQKLELVSAALVGTAVGALAVAFTKTDTEQKLEEGFEDMKSKAMAKVDEIKKKVEESTGEAKEVLLREIENAQMELDKARKMLQEEE